MSARSSAVNEEGVSTAPAHDLGDGPVATDEHRVGVALEVERGLR